MAEVQPQAVTPMTTNVVTTALANPNAPPNSSTQPPKAKGFGKQHRKFPYSKNRPNSSGNPGRHGGVSYAKATAESIYMNTPLRTVFPIFTTMRGVSRLSELTHSVLAAKDKRLTMTSNMIKYVTTLAALAKANLCAMENSIALPEDLSALKQATKGLYLPDVIARYVETFGTVDLNGIKVAPMVGTATQFKTWNGFSPKSFLTEEECMDIRTCWEINVNVVLNWGDVAGRAQRSGLNFRLVDYAEKGTEELLSSFSATAEGSSYLLEPFTPTKTITATAKLGAAYRFREEGGEWPGKYSLTVTGLFHSPSFLEDTFLQERILDSFM
jgi:hypothetical protein